MTEHTKKPIEERVASVEVGMTHLSGQVETMARDMKHGFEAISRGSKTQWSPVIAALGIALVIGGSFFALIKADLQRLEVQAGSNAAQATDRTRDLDTSLQREMRDLDRVAATALKAQRELIQTEMKWIKSGLAEEHEHLDNTVKNVSDLSGALRENSAMIDLIMTGKLKVDE